MKDKRLLAIVKKARKQDPGAFDELCNLKAREIVYLCIVQMSNPHDGEDAAQEVFIRMQKSITQLRAPEAFNVWLNRLIHTTCMNMKRDSMKHKDALPIESFDDFQWQDESELSLPQEFMEDADKRSRLTEVISNLPEKYRTCIVLHYYQSLSYADIAKVMDISVDQVNNNLRMARKYIKLELEENAEIFSLSGALPLIAAGPVLTMGLGEAAAAVPGSLISGCLASAGIKATAAGAAAAAGKSSGVAAKVAALVAAAAVIGAIVIAALNSPGEEAQPPTPTSTPPAAVEPEQESPAPEQEQAVFSGTVSGRVLQQSGAGTQGMAGVHLALVDPQNEEDIYYVVQTVGDNTGAFLFEGVAAGEYRLKVFLPDHAQPLAGGRADVNAQSGLVAVDGREVLTVDAGNADAYTNLDIEVRIPSEINGHISLRQDGQQLAFEAHFEDMEILLLDPQGNLVARTWVDTNGDYRFVDPEITPTGHIHPADSNGRAGCRNTAANPGYGN